MSRLPLLIAAVLIAGACRDRIKIPDDPEDAPIVPPVETDFADPDSDVNTDTDIVDTDVAAVDADGDGFTDDVDCDDTNDGVFPGADETPYNGADDDCDPATPDDDLDQDSEGIATDCDDDDPSQRPGADEICNGEDDNCDGSIDEGVLLTWYSDLDGDGFGDAETEVSACDAPADTVSDATDCDDGDGTVYPLAPELCDGVDNDCDGTPDNDPVDGTTYFRDADGDGYGDVDVPLDACELPVGYALTDDDCVDSDTTIHPDAEEICDGVDQNCNTVLDDDAIDQSSWWLDGDGDGYGVDTSEVVACVAPADHVANGDDCDDTSSASYPGADEVCDEADNDCNGTIDDGAIDATTVYRDVDEDGFGDDTAPLDACEVLDGYAATAGDCDDGVPTVYPDAEELCDGLDNDCDTDIDEDATQEATWYADVDGDGFGIASETLTSCVQPDGYAAAAGDCGPTDAEVFPGADERCNGADDDCNSVADDNATDAVTFYLDADGDSFGGTLASVVACEGPANFVANDDDCNDRDELAFPAADERCNGLDDDCDTDIDEDAIDPTAFFFDGDGDGFGNPNISTLSCEAPDSTTPTAGDCDDSDADINPLAEEVCNGADDDCDETVDGPDASDAQPFYADNDGDGFGNPAVVRYRCEVPDGFADNDQDCLDTRGDVFPGAPEACDLVDNDCDDAVDEDAGDASIFYADTDGDGFGDDDVATEACAAPFGYLPRAGACDDTQDTINPVAPERCNGLDDDCDVDIDEDAIDRITTYVDADGDGVGAGTSTLACDLPEGSSTRGDDCDDREARRFPGNPEVCDGLDSNCDAVPDSPVPATAPTWYGDGDGDGFGNPSLSVTQCQAPPGFVSNPDDCADGRSDSFPGAPEQCDSFDNDCDGALDNGAATNTWFLDEDGDGFGVDTTTDACNRPEGYAAVSGDCDDTTEEVNPGRLERCNGFDDDCVDGIDIDAVDASTVFVDGDGDGYGVIGVTVVSCPNTDGVALQAGDCDDDDDARYPGATEICDGIDTSCDGVIDSPLPPDAPTWYGDGDGDGFGLTVLAQQSCEPIPGFVLGDGDCDDADDTRFPGNPELCDGVDNDCNSIEDDGFDGDGDGFSACGGDCEDGDDTVFPGATEICNGRDDDCDSAIDEDTVGSDWFLDLDGDGFGQNSTAVSACTRPTSLYSDEGDDCDDDSDTVYPGAPLACDDTDADCDGFVDNDSDDDGYADVTCGGTDCDDSDDNIKPEVGFGCALGTSCLDILGGPNDVGDGIYTIDADGFGVGEPPREVFCDMSNGGFTGLDDEDFADDVDDDWNVQETNQCIGETMIGGYGRSQGPITRTYDLGGIPHTEVRVALTYFAIDSWDRELAFVELDGTRIWSANPWWRDVPRVSACGNTGWPDQPYDIDETIPHTAPTVTLTADSELNQGTNDESMGIGNVRLWVR